MTVKSWEVYILFTNVRDINYANIIFNPNLLSQHQSVELSLHLIQSVHITDYLILYFLNYLDWSFLFRQESRARGLADNQEEKYNFFYLISIICCLQHWNIILICSWKKCFNILLFFLPFYNSKISTIMRKVVRRRYWGFFLKIIFHSLKYFQLKPGICQLNITQFPHCLTEFQWWIRGESIFGIINFIVMTTLNLFTTNCFRSWQGQVTGDNEGNGT